MTLSQQVCSLDLAKKLKELGVKQESFFYHYKLFGKIPIDATEYWHILERKKYIEDLSDFCSAFTVAELGELISGYCNEWSQGWNDSGCFWQFQYGGRGCGNMLEGFGEKFSALDADDEDSKTSSEANARAALLIHILESNLLPAS